MRGLLTLLLYLICAVIVLYNVFKGNWDVATYFLIMAVWLEKDLKKEAV